MLPPRKRHRRRHHPLGIICTFPKPSAHMAIMKAEQATVTAFQYQEGAHPNGMMNVQRRTVRPVGKD